MQGITKTLASGQRLSWPIMLLVILMGLAFTSSSPTNNVRIKRDVSDKPVIDFINNLKTGDVQLVILLERSRTVGRWHFYLRARKLVSFVLRYYTKIGQDNVKVALVTYASDLKVEFNELERQEPAFKCKIWETYWENVIMNDDEEIWKGTDVRMAYEKARGLFEDAGSGNSFTKRYIWVLTSGQYEPDSTNNKNPIAIRNELVNDMNVEIVSTKIGPYQGDYDMIVKIVSTSSHHGQEVQDWKTRLEKIDPINDPPSLVLIDNAASSYCDTTYGFITTGVCNTSNCDQGICNKDCICLQNFGVPNICPKYRLLYVKVCDMYSGRTGRYCDIDEEECVRTACANEGTCHEKDGADYSCTCTGSYDPIRKCETNCVYRDCRPPIDTNETALIGSTTGSGIMLLLIGLVVGGCCCWKKKACCWKKKAAQATEAVTYTNPDRLEVQREVTTTTVGTISIIPRFKNNIPILPTDMPSTVFRALANPTNRKHIQGQQAPKRGTIPSMFRWLPKHLRTSQGQKEIQAPDDKINENKSDEETDYVDADSYENSGSRKMPGWNEYIWQLATAAEMRNLAIVRYDRSAYVTTCTVWFLPSKKELSHIYTVLKKLQTNVTISIKASSYNVTRNDGKMLEAWLTGRNLDVLCIGMSKQYLTLGVKTDPNNSGNCYNEVKFVRDHLSEQNK